MHASTTTAFVVVLVALLVSDCFLASAEEQQNQPKSRTWLQTAFRTVSGRGGTRGKKSDLDLMIPVQHSPFGRPVLGPEVIFPHDLLLEDNFVPDNFAPDNYEQ
uniref:Uncharacterized protein n=1 Tax=Plectus sambesii TaxID=2011161 RepID=A0A914VLN3_9BILA